MTRTGRDSRIAVISPAAMIATSKATRRETAEESIRRTGSRVTSARVQVLATLLEADRALSHHEVEQALARQRPVDRVTVYRVLEWLTRNELAHKISGDDRIWRFNAGADAHTSQHAHFTCKQCRRVLCLDDIPADFRPRLPGGYSGEEVEVNVKGVCDDCGLRTTASPGRSDRGARRVV